MKESISLRFVQQAILVATIFYQNGTQAQRLKFGAIGAFRIGTIGSGTVEAFRFGVNHRLGNVASLCGVSSDRRDIARNTSGGIIALLRTVVVFARAVGGRVDNCFKLDFGCDIVGCCPRTTAAINETGVAVTSRRQVGPDKLFK